MPGPTSSAAVGRPSAGSEMALLRRVATGRPPFTSVYLSIDRATEDAAQRLDIEWGHVHQRLEEQRAPAGVLERLEQVVRATNAETVAVVMDGDGNEHVRSLPEPVDDLIAVHGPLPRLGPLIDFAHRNPPHVIVRIDRRGADLAAVVDAEVRRVEQVEGDDDDPISKVAPGGWSQRRFQERAENTWHRNAGEVAAEVVELVEQVDAALVVVAGDERARGELVEQLPPEVARLVHLTETGGRAVDGSYEELQHEVQRLVATVVAESTADVMRRFVEHRGRHDSLANGPGETFEALRAALVDSLLVHDDPDDQRGAWYDVSSPSLVSIGPDVLRDLGFEPLEGRLVDVAIWSAFGTGADVHLLPGSGPNVPEHGIGGLLRADVDLRS